MRSSRGIYIRARLSACVTVLVFTVAAAVSLTHPAPTNAATADTVNFQAKLMNNVGAIAPDGNYNVQFKLYDVSSGGTALWTETWYDSNGVTAGNDNRVRVQNGYLTVDLGAQNAFPSINWDQDLYITMNIGGTTQTATPTWDGEMNPRLKLTAVPYAFSAGNLANINTGSGFKSTLVFQGATGQDQTIQIPDNPLHATDDVCLLSLANCAGTGGGITGSGTQNYVAKFDTSGSHIGNSDIFDNGTYIGIGTASNVGTSLVNIQGSGTSSSTLFVQGAASATAATAVIKQSSSQTGDLIDLKDSSGNINASINSTGNILSLGRVATTGSPLGGQIIFSDGTTDGYSLSLQSGTLTGNTTVSIPATSSTDTVCLYNLGNCVGAGGGITGTGTQNYLTKFNNGAGTTIGNSSLFDNGSFLGLNTTTNNGLLSIQGSGTTQSSLFVQAAASASAPTIAIKQATSQGGDLLQLIDTSGNPLGGFSANGSFYYANSGFTSTLSTATLTANQLISLPNESGTLCVQGSSNCGFELTGGTDFIQNQTASTQTAGFKINGNGTLAILTANTSVLTSLIDAPSGGGSVAIGTTNATGGISLNQNTTIAAGKSISFAAGAGNFDLHLSSGTFQTGTGSVTINGAATAIAGITLTNGGSLATQKGTDYSTTGSSNDVNFGSASLYRLTGASAQTITGIAGGVDGRQLTLVNAGSNAAVLKNNDSTDSSSGNLIITGTGTDLSLPSGGSITLIYDSGSNVWRVNGTVPTPSSGVTTLGSYSSSNHYANGANISGNTLTLGSADASNPGLIDTSAQTFAGAKTFSALITGNAGLNVSGATNSLQGNTTIGTTAGDTVGIGNSTGAITFTGNSSSTFVINGVTVDASEFNLLDGHNTALVDLDDAVSTAIVGTGALNAGSITSGFGSIDTGADNISTTGTVAGGTVTITTTGALDSTTAGAINIGKTSGGSGTSINLNQATTAIAGITLTNGGSLATQKGTDYSTTGTSNDVSFGTAGLYRLTGASAQTITGIAGGVDGRILTLVNAGTTAATIKNNDSTDSTTGNLIISGTGGDVSLPAGASMTLIYDAGDTVWRVSGSAASSGGAGVNTIGAIAGTSNANGATITGTTLNLTAADGTNGGVVTTSAQTFAGLKTFQGGITAANINTTAGQATSLGNSTGSLTINGDSGSTFVINGSTIDATEFTLLDGKNAALVDVNDAVNTAITGTGALTTGSIGSGFGAISTASNITTSANISTTGTGTITSAGLLTASGGLTAANINTTATQATSLGNSTGAFTFTGNSSSTFVVNGVTVDASEFNLLDTKNAPLVDTNDAVATAITGTGTLTTGSINWSGAIATSGNISTSGTGTITSAGIITANGGVLVANTGNLATQKGTDFATNGISNDVSFGTAGLYRLTGASAQTITGIAGGVDGRILTLVNAGTTAATIKNNDSTDSTTGNLIISGTGGDVSLPAGASMTLIYDSGSNVWRVSGSAAASGGAGVNTVGTFAATNHYADGASISGTTITLGDADATHPGLVDIIGQTFAGLKTFSGGITSASINTTGGINTVLGNATGTFQLASSGGLNVSTAGALTGVSGITYASGAYNFDQSASSGTFATGTGTVSLNGATTVASGKNFTVTSGTTSLTGALTQTGGAFSLTGNAASTLATTSGGITIDTTTTAGQTIAIGNSNITHTIQIGTASGSAQTISIGSSNAGSTLGLSAGGGITLNNNTSVAAGVNISFAAGAGTFDQSNSTGTFATGTGAVSLNGSSTVAAGKNFSFAAGAGNFDQSNSTGTFATGTGAVSINGSATIAAGKSITYAAGAGTFDMHNSTGSFQTGTGAVSINGNTTFATGAGISYAASSTANVDFSNSSGTFSTTTGAVTLAGNTSVAAGKSITFAAGAGNFDQHNSTGSFQTGTGAVSINGNTTFATTAGISYAASSTANVDFSNTTGTFKTGTGAVSLQGGTTVTGSNTFTVGTGLASFGGGLAVTAGNTDFTTSIATKIGTDYTTVGTQDAINFGNVSLVRLNGATAQTIQGIANGRDGYRLTIVNAGTNAATIQNNASGTSGDSIVTGTGGSVTIPTGASVELVYDNTASPKVWRIVGSSAASGGAGVNTVGTFAATNHYADGASISGTTITLGDADATHPGLVDIIGQTFAGLKTFSGGITSASINTTGGINTVLGNATGTFQLASSGGLNVSTAGALTGVSGITYASGAYNFDQSASSGTFATGTGTVSLNGATTVASGKNFTVTSGTTSLTGALTQTGGAFSLTGNAASTLATTSGGITIDTTTTAGQTIAIGNSNITHTIQIGTASGSAQTISIGSSNAGSTLGLSAGGGITLNNNTSVAAGVNISFAAGAGTFDQSNSTGTFATGTGAVSLNGSSTVAAGKNFSFAAGAGNFDQSNSTGTFATGTGAVSINGSATIAAGKSITYAAGAGTFDMHNSTGSFQTGTGAVSINGNTTFATGAGISYAASSTANVDFSNSSGTFSTTTGAVTLAGNTSVAAGKSITFAAGAGNFDQHNSTGSFQTGTGAVSINGNTTFATTAGISYAASSTANVDFSNTTGTFKTGTGAVSLQGGTTVTGSNTFTVGTGLASFGGGLAVTAGNTDFTTSIATKIGTDYTTVGTQDAINFGNVSLVRLNGATAQTIQGIANGRDGYRLTIVNAGTNAATIQNNASGTSGDSIVTGTGGSVTIPTGASVELVYDNTASPKVWRIVGSSAASGGAGVNTVGTFAATNHYADGASISGTTITLGDADATHPGLVDIIGQTFAGLKTFSGGITSASINTTGGINTVLGNATGTFQLASSGGLNVSTAGALTGVSGITYASGAYNFDQSASSGTFATGTGTVSLNGATTVASGKNFTVTSGTTSLTGALTQTGGAFSLTGNAASTLATTSGGITIDTTTTAGQTIAIGNSNITHTIQIGTASGSAQTISIGSSNAGSTLGLSAGGGITLNNNTSVAAGVNISFAAGAGIFDQSNSTGTFATGTGAVSLNGSSTVAAGKNFSFAAGAGNFDQSNSTGTFATGTGAVSLNGNTVVKPTVNSSVAFQVQTAAGNSNFTVNTDAGTTITLGHSGSGVNGRIGTALATTTGSGTASLGSWTTSTFQKTVKATHTLVGILTTDNAGGTVHTFSSITDTAGNTYHVDATINDGAGTATNESFVISGYVNNPIGLSDTMTFTLASGSHSRWAVDMEDFDNIVSSSSVDKTATNSGTLATTFTSTATATTTAANELVFGGFGTSYNAGRTFTAGSGFTAIPTIIGTTAGSGNRGAIAEWKYVTATGTQTATGTTNSTATYNGIAVTYKLSATPDTSAVGSIAFNNGSGNLITLAASPDATPYSLTLPTALNTTAGQCLQATDLAGTLGWAGCGVTLQSTSPGVADVGNIHVTGTIIADTALSSAAETLTSTTVTSGTILNVSQNTSAFTGTAILVNAANGSGSFSSGKFIDFQNNGTSRFNIDSNGVVTLRGGQTADVTTAAGTAPGALTVQPGNNTSASSTGASTTIQAGNDSGGTSSTGGVLTLQGGNATGSGTKTGGGVTIDSGSGATAGGAVSIGGGNAASIGIGRSGITTTVTGNFLQNTGSFSLTGNAASTLATTAGGLTIDTTTTAGQTIAIANSNITHTVQIGTASGSAQTISIGSSNAGSTLGLAAGGGITISNNVALANGVSITYGTSGNFDQHSSSGTFQTGTGAVSINGSTTFATGAAIGYAASSTANVDFSNTSGTFLTGTGNVSLQGNTSVTGSKTFTVGTGLASFGGGLAVTAGNTDFTNGIATKAGTVFTTPGATNGAALNVAGFYTLNTSGAAQTIQGILAGRDGQLLTLTNLNALAVTLTNNYATSPNKAIITGTGVDISLPQGASAELIYDATATVWRIVSAVAGNGSGVTSVGAISGTSNANGGTVSGTVLTLTPADGTNGGVVTNVAQQFKGIKTFNDGIVSSIINATGNTTFGNASGTFQLASSGGLNVSTTGALTGVSSIDSSAALTIGASTATSIGIGRSGITTTITGGLTQNTGALNLQATGASQITTTSGGLTIDTVTAAGQTIAIGNSNITHTVQIGTASGSAQTITIGSSNAGSTLGLSAGGGITLNNNTSVAAGVNITFAAGAGNFDQSSSTGTFATGTGAVSLNGSSTVAAGKNFSFAAGAGNFDQSNSTGTFATGTGAVSINGSATIAAGKNITYAAGAGTFDMHNSTGTLQTGTGAVSINGATTFAAGAGISYVASSTANVDFSNSSGTFSTTTGNVTLAGNTSVAAGKSITFAAGAGNFDQHNSTGTFQTGTGAVSLNGDTTIASGKNFTQSGAGTFSTGTGAVSINGATTFATTASIGYASSSTANVDFSNTSGTFKTGTGLVSLQGGTTVTSSNTFTVGTGLTSLGGGLAVTAGNTDFTNGIATKAGTSFTTPGATNGAALNVAGFYTLNTSGAAQTIQGILAGRDGQQLTLTNINALTVTLTNNFATSPNKAIITGTGNDVTLPQGSSVQLVYDATATVWRVIGATAATGGSGVNTIGAISGTSNANGATISGTTLTLTPADGTNGGVVTNVAQQFKGIKTFNDGIVSSIINATGNTTFGNASGTFQLASSGGLNVSTTGALTGVSSIDSSAALTIGASTATSIGIGKSGINTTITGNLIQQTGTFSLTGNGASTLAVTAGGLTIDTTTTAGQTIAIANSNITHTVQIGTASGSAQTISIGSSNASSTLALAAGGGITLSNNTTLAASQSITITGGNTASRPGTPTAGMIYYDSTTSSLITYNGTKWVSDRSDTIIVAASTSSQAEKDAADYVTTGTNDQTIINNALTDADPAGTGRKVGKVLLLAGTYTTSDVISVPNNTTLAGEGSGSLIQFANLGGASKNMITNTTTGGAGTGVVIRDLALDGVRATNGGAATIYGIYANGLGNGTTLAGITITNVMASNFNTYGIYLSGTYDSVISGNTLYNNITGLYITGNKNNISNNISYANTNYGVVLNGSLYDNVSNNNVFLNVLGGMLLNGNSQDNVITGNNIYNNGGGTTNEGIILTGTGSGSNDNLITANHIIDSACSTNCYSIDIQTANVNRTYIANNTFNAIVTYAINDSGTGTIYGGQLSGSNVYTIQESSGIQLTGPTTVTGNLTQNTGTFSLSGNAASTIATTSGTLGITGAGAVTLSTTAVAGGSSTVGISTGNASAGTAGAITIDNGTSFSGTSQLNIGNANAGQINIGHANITTAITGIATITNTSASTSLAITTNTTPTTAAVTINSTSGTGTDKLLNLQSGKFTVDATGNVVALGSLTTGTTGQFSVANNGDVTNSGKYNTDTLTSSALTFGTTSAATLSLTQAAAATTGGNLTIQGGQSGSGAVNGGDLILQGGATGGTGVQGNVKLSSTVFTTSAQQSFGSGGGVSQSSVDSGSALEITSTVAGPITVTIPAPTTKVNGRLLYLEITGTNPVTISPSGGSSFTMNGNTAATLVWNTTTNGWLNAGADGGSNNYIQNQTASTQTAGFKINGAGTVGGLFTGTAGITISGGAVSLQGNAASAFTTTTGALTLDAAAAINLGTSGSPTATSININQNAVVAAGKSISITGGITSTRPASPTEGMLYYDTTTKQLLVYANGKWQADRSSSTLIVGTSASGGTSTAIASNAPDGADYVNTSTTSAQTVINSALSALGTSGGTVYLMEGTYIIDGSISIPNNVTLTGAGNNTIVKLKNADNATIDMIVNTDTSTGTGVNITNIAIDGNQANQTAGTQQGIFFSHMGNTTPVNGGRITGVQINNVRTRAISLSNTNLTIISNNTVLNAGANGIYVINSQQDNIQNNVVQNSKIGVYAGTGTTNLNITENVLAGNGTFGVQLDTGATNHVVSLNIIRNSGGASFNNGIDLVTSSNNSITENNISDTAAATNNYAINITDSGSTNNLMSNNLLTGGTINDIGTGTYYGGQLSGTSVYTIQDSTGIQLTGPATVTGSLTQTGGAVSLTGNAASQISTTGAFNLGIDAGAVLNLGTGNATSINIGHGTIATAITGNVSITNTNATTTLAVNSNSNAATGLIVANNTNGTPSGNLLNLQNNSTSKFSVDVNGNVISSYSSTAGTAGGFEQDATNTSGIEANGFFFNRTGAGGTTTNGVNIVNNNSTSTLTNGIAITNTAGTLTHGISLSGTIGSDIYRQSGSLDIQNGTDAANAIAFENSQQANVLSIDTSNTGSGLNMISNGGAETGLNPPTGWSAQLAGPTIASDTTTPISGTASGKVTTTAVANSGVKVTFGSAPATSTTQIYTVSFSAKFISGTAMPSTLDVEYSANNGTTLAACSNLTSTAVTATVTKYSCSFIPGSTTVTTAVLVIRQTDAAARVIDIDNINVIQQNTTGTQNTGVINIGGGATGQGLTLLKLDTAAGNPFLGASSGGVAIPALAGAMYFDTTAGKMQCYDGSNWGACGAAPNTLVTLTPEYAGAVLNGTGVGTLTSNFCGNGTGLTVNTSFCASGEARNYYQWVSPQATIQTYSVYVTYKLPGTFKAFVGNVSLNGRVDSLTNAGVNYSVFRSTGSSITQCGGSANPTPVVGQNYNQTIQTGSANAWTAGTINPVTSCSFAANDYVILRIDVSAGNNANAYIENLNFQFSNQ